jgi:hypothetical protein
VVPPTVPPKLALPTMASASAPLSVLPKPIVEPVSVVAGAASVTAPV